ncbi:DNA/RNA nuclease SfsA [uncultured Clostridium sp.]|uniref:DNA/RNA nuclease SfsA n=1 Tax=uncultured Clostridium sp. TaxID=59620 RepID=UPI00262EC129|nr:DNA/RNA nuclease SfsA [uncultured Clostridium sp.]
MEYGKEIVIGEFIDRPNRFNALVKIDGKEEIVHVPNTGRCKEILTVGTKILLRKEDNMTRKTAYDLIGAYKNGSLINIDSQIPNKVVLEALINKKIGKLKEYTDILREKTYGKSRFDFKLAKENGEIYYLEVKGVTLEENGFASFPDAPTDRGRKHLLELVDVKEEGMGAGVLFLLQMENMKEFTSNDKNDPAFGEALRYAKEKGVDIFVYSCIVTEKEITLDKEIKLNL